MSQAAQNTSCWAGRNITNIHQISFSNQGQIILLKKRYIVSKYRLGNQVNVFIRECTYAQTRYDEN